MREIKFRAWHKADEKMYEVYGFAQNKSFRNHLFWFLKGKQFPMPNGAVVIMQYTGLKDKTGKSVYEGDIVRVDYESNRLYLEGFEITGEVIWSPEHAQFLVKTNVKHLKDGSTEYDLYEIADNEYYEVLEIEVIGNVFEDSHLLEEQHG